MTAASRSVVLAVLVVAAAVGVLVHATHSTIDLDVYRFGGLGVLEGTPLYDGADPVTGLPFTYPPFAALLLAPVAVPSGAVAAALWCAASFGALLLTVTLVRRAQGTVDPPGVVVAVGTAALALEPVWQTFGFGQVNLLLLLAVVVDVLRPERRWSGVLVGVAAGIKLTPLVFVVLLVLVGRRDAAARAGATFAATVALGAVVLPGASWAYWTQVVHDAGRVGGPAYASNQSVYGALTRLLGDQPPAWLWVTVAAPLAAAALVLGARTWQRGDRVLGAGLAAVAMLLASPISWSHHWVWAVVVTLGLWPRSRPAAIAWTAVFVAAPIWWVPHAHDRELTWTPAQQLLGNSYLLAALALVSCLAVAESHLVARRIARAGAPNRR